MALLDLANGELLASGAEPSVVLEPTADAAALAAAAAQGGVIAIRFPSATAAAIRSRCCSASVTASRARSGPSVI